MRNKMELRFLLIISILAISLSLLFAGLQAL